MVNETLTSELIEDGKNLLIKLDRTGPSIEAAMWIQSEDSGAWSLYFSVKGYATLGPRVFYKSVQRAFLKDPKPKSLKLDDVRIAPPNEPSVAALRAFAGIGGVSQVRFTNNFFNGVRIADALVYRTVPSASR